MLPHPRPRRLRDNWAGWRRAASSLAPGAPARDGNRLALARLAVRGAARRAAVDFRSSLCSSRSRSRRPSPSPSPSQVAEAGARGRRCSRVADGGDQGPRAGAGDQRGAAAEAAAGTTAAPVEKPPPSLASAPPLPMLPPPRERPKASEAVAATAPDAPVDIQPGTNDSALIGKGGGDRYQQDADRFHGNFIYPGAARSRGIALGLRTSRSSSTDKAICWTCLATPRLDRAAGRGRAQRALLFRRRHGPRRPDQLGVDAPYGARRAACRGTPTALLARGSASPSPAPSAGMRGRVSREGETLSSLQGPAGVPGCSTRRSPARAASGARNNSLAAKARPRL